MGLGLHRGGCGSEGCIWENRVGVGAAWGGIGVVVQGRIGAWGWGCSPYSLFELGGDYLLLGSGGLLLFLLCGMQLRNVQMQAQLTVARRQCCPLGSAICVKIT